MPIMLLWVVNIMSRRMACKLVWFYTMMKRKVVGAVGADRKGASDAMVTFSVGVIDQSGYVGEKVSFKSDQ